MQRSFSSFKESLRSDPVLDRAAGCFLAACVGDAAGAPLEFFGKRITEKDVLHALTFPGGGALHVGRGQITDDSELAISLARGLLLHPRVPQGDADAIGAVRYVESIAHWYHEWFRSPPFDIGNTTRQALSGSAGNPRTMHKNASMDSQGNGSLMRSTPIAVWGHRLADDDVALVGVLDSLLTHPNPRACACEGMYVIIAARLIRGNDVKDAFEAARAWLATRFSSAYLAASSLLLLSSTKTSLLQHAEDAAKEVCAWFDAASDVSNPSRDAMPMTTVNIGWVKIAFSLAIRELAKQQPFEKALADTLLLGGDVDTNGAIVAGLCGARVGLSGIPDAWAEAVLSSQPRRPEWLWPRSVLTLISDLAARAPSSFSLQ
eukprot:ANDGO_01245.mRNA.1 Putative ADP-ribosyl glycohydrolase L543